MMQVKTQLISSSLQETRASSHSPGKLSFEPFSLEMQLQVDMRSWANRALIHSPRRQSFESVQQFHWQGGLEKAISQ